MATMHKLTFMAVTLILGGGLLQSAGAQVAQPISGSDSRPRYQEPVPAPGGWAISPLPRPSAGPETMAPPSSSPDAGLGPGHFDPREVGAAH